MIYIIKKIKKKIQLNINIKGQIIKNSIFFHINNKKKIKDKILKKNNIIIFFGYTLCPDICPKILEYISNKIKFLKNFYKTKFIFFSINWKYENSELTQKYISKLKIKNIISFCTTGKITEKISNNFRIIYKYNKNKKINHSNLLYTINKYWNILFINTIKNIKI